MKKSIIKILITVGVVATVYLVLRAYGVTDDIRLENVPKIKTWVEGFGRIAPLVYIGLYLVSTVFFLPGAPVTILAGFVFGPLWGIFYASVASIISVSVAFLIARYVARDLVEGWVKDNAQFRKIDEQVEEQGWRIVMFTRVVPIFPFNLQNYAYGLTSIRFPTYVLVSAIFMLPGTAVFVQLGGAFVRGEGNIWKTLLYLGIAGVLLLLLSLIPKLLRKYQTKL
ncbi:TVP38/TMEM64 family protein [Candidatus Poribacteria bacterium]|nr:TVP38/TMEM64 family protein [Candidatus Poribacteria bacterium]MXV85817.1 TVP38/TMEM64 family protein [Candidatus Poribacteria bacterium]MYA57192.1 TVP38/TMEM64 family protein [Candidatus Poribacteria bacterium]